MWGGRLGQREERKYIQDGREGQEVHAPLQGSSTHASLMDTRFVHYSPEISDPNSPSRVINPEKLSQLKCTRGYSSSEEKPGKVLNRTIFSQDSFLSPALRLMVIRVHSHCLWKK